MDTFCPLPEYLPSKPLSDEPKFLVVSEGYYPGFFATFSEEEAATKMYFLLCQYLNRNADEIINRLEKGDVDLSRLILFDVDTGNLYLDPTTVSINEKEKSWTTGHFYTPALKYRARQLKELGVIKIEDTVIVIPLHHTFTEVSNPEVPLMNLKTYKDYKTSTDTKKYTFSFLEP